MCGRGDEEQGHHPSVAARQAASGVAPSGSCGGGASRRWDGAATPVLLRQAGAPAVELPPRGGSPALCLSSPRRAAAVRRARPARARRHGEQGWAAVVRRSARLRGEPGRVDGWARFFKGKEVFLCVAVCWRQKYRITVCCAKIRSMKCAWHKIII